MSRLEEIIEIQKEIEEASYKIAKLEGEDESLNRQLKDKHNCKNTKDARKRITKLKETLKEKRSANERRLTALNKVFRKHQ